MIDKQSSGFLRPRCQSRPHRQQQVPNNRVFDRGARVMPKPCDAIQARIIGNAVQMRERQVEINMMKRVSEVCRQVASQVADSDAARLELLRSY
jgi:hypothetical protein